LRVEVDDNHALAVKRQRGADVNGGRRLADAAFLVDHSSDSHGSTLDHSHVSHTSH